MEQAANMSLSGGARLEALAVMKPSSDRHVASSALINACRPKSRMSRQLVTSRAVRGRTDVGLCTVLALNPLGARYENADCRGGDAL